MQPTFTKANLHLQGCAPLARRKVGTSYLVEKAALARFLAQLDSAADPAHELKRIKALRARRTNLKRKLSQVLHSDQAPFGDHL